ncbi:MAG: phosphatidylserine decarboxylase [Rhodospirillaceae bacterium]|jgi:phosphatidylserine decarboxylase|nr:phosphatidylserine decarboxylase [Rhodospirillaceae bacterium]
MNFLKKKSIHPEGWKFIPLFTVITLFLFWIWNPLGWFGVVLTIWCAYFFRNPDRITPTNSNLIISPADGIVQMITAAPPPLELMMGDEPLLRISIFMNIFNVHVNRVPITGKVLKRVYTPGKFFNASFDKASCFNEREAIRLLLTDNREIAFVQIAGMIARRIRCDISEGQTILTGERFGLIRFGSRVDVYLPSNVQTMVSVGQTMIAGETALADLTINI